MRKKYSLLYKVLSFISGTSLILQSFVPLLSYNFLTKPVYAEDPAPTEEVTPTQELTPEPTVAPTAESTPQPTPEAIETPAEVTPAPTEEVTPVPVVEENQPPSQNTAPPNETGPPPDLEKPAENSVSGQIVPTPTSVEKVCLTDAQEIKDTTNDNWEINLNENWTQTKEPVTLGVKYVYPQENNVTVTFKCLPKDGTTPLKIQKIKISDLKLPEGTNPYGEYAYDITTGMQDGTFEYDVTLPKPENKAAKVSFMEEPNSALQTVSEEKLNQEGDKVKVESLDHFTIFIATYADLGLATSEITYLQGDTVYTNSTSLDSGKYYRVDIIEQDGITRHSAAACTTGVTSLEGSYVLSTSAPVGTNWNAEITKYNNSGDCGSRSNIQDTTTATFEVKSTTPTSLSNPSIAQTCGLDIALVIDNSNSISSSELAQMKTALTGFVSALSGTPTQFSVTRFGTTASVIQPFTSSTTDVNNAINSVTTGGGGTNWKEGIISARGTFDPTSKPNLMIFASDGNPTYPDCGGATTCAADVNSAVIEANTAKSSNIRILALGIGEVALGPGDGLRVENLKAISGHIVNGPTVLGSDVVTTDFPTMAAQLAAFASQTCGGTIFVNKYIDTVSNATRGGAGWAYSVTGPQSYSNNLGTDANGQGNTGTIPAGSGYAIVETNMLPGYSYGSANCKNQAGAPVGSSITNGVGSIALGDSDIISCDFVNTTNYVPVCGNSIVDPGEQCDLGNQNGLVCSPAYGQSCNYCGVSCQKVTVSGPYCGDGSINGTEQCDDGNVANGDGCSATCQVESGTLTVIKHVINDNGGTKSAGDFTITVTGGTPSSFSGSESGTTVTIPANGSYSVSETPIAGYANSYSADCTGTITAGGSKTCTITNDDIAPILHLRKIVINDNGNTVPATAWTLYATGPTSLSGTTPVDSNASFSAGTYLLSENGPTGYRTSAWVCVGGGSQSGSHGETLALGLGESATCTITNDDMSPRLRLRKVVINDNGGTATVSDFTLTADGAGSNDLSGTSPVDSDTLQPGTFTLSETNLPGYTASAWSCVGGTQNGSDITIQNNEEADCTITNDDIQPKLTITKSVIGGSAIVSDFNLFAGTTQFTSGIQAGINAGTHAITETGTQTANYTASFGGDCPQGSVTLNPGDVKSCTITNTRNTGTLYVHKLVDTDGNGTYDATDTGANSLGFLWGLDGVTPNRAMGSLPIVDTGTHNVNENSVTGYHFVGWYTDGDSCASPTGLTLPASVSVGMNSITTVTLCNARDNGSLKVNKLLDADGNGSFETSNPASFTWNVNGSGTNVMGSTVSVSPGSYSINENTVADYHTVGWYRNGGEGNCSNLDSSQLPASVDVFANTTTEITICNTRSTGTVTLDKVTNPSGDPTLFNLEIENSDQNGGHTPFGTYQVADSTTPVVVTVPTGWYGVDETALTGWVRGSTDCVRDDGGGQMYYNFYVGSGENVTCTYQNVRDTGTVVVHKDVQGPNGESVLDTSHTFQVSLDGAGTQNITDDGTVTYTNVPTGSHSVTESSIASDYNLYGISTSPDGSGHTGGLTVNVTNGTTDVYVTNRQQTAHITVIKRVFAPDGQTDVNDTNGQFTFDVSTQSAVLGDDASYTFDVNPGNYDVTEELNSEYVFAGCRAVYDNNSVGITVPNGENVTIGSGDTITVTCQNNQKPGTIIVTKYSDINGNGQVDTEDGDGVLSGWTMNITNGDDLHLSEQTGNDGTATFDTLSPDTYGLSENQQDGWRQTNIICDQEKISTEIADNILVPHVLAQDELSTDSTHTVPVDSNQTIHCSILNQPLTPIITITKTNDTGGADKAPGDSVLFTITVTLDETGGLANNVMVTDLPSQGFTYRTGSWTASSDVRGDLKSASITTEPTYASPGTWQLGNMTPGEHVTLTYLADISGDIQSGLYKDLAWAQGTDVLSNTVIANDTTGVFVGTEVSVLRTDKAGMSLNVIQESSVLGASTELPATGASSAWLILAGLLFVGGVGAVGTGMVFNRKPYKKSKRRLHA